MVVINSSIFTADYRKWTPNPTEKITHDPGYAPPEAPFEGTSNYQTDYISKRVNPRQSMKPSEAAKSSDEPFADRTGYRDYYIKHPLPKKELREKQEYSPSKAPLDGLSNYMKDYISKDMDKTKSCKPDNQAYQSGAPFQDDTTHRTDYQPRQAERPFVREPEQYMKPTGDMDLYTTTHTDYTRKPIERQAAKRPEHRKMIPGKFVDTTNYNTDFRKWGLGERPVQTMKSDYHPPEMPFEGISNYQTDYLPKVQPPRKSMKPLESARMTEDPFPDRTGYRDYYIKHPMPKREMREKQEYSPNKAPLDGLSNYMKDYVTKDMGKTKSCKPDTNAYQSGAPFEDDTTHRMDYKRWQADRPFVHEPDQYTKPEGDIDFHTTTHTDYTKKAMDRRITARPEAARRLPGKFDGTTNYNEDFRKWPNEGRQPQTMKSGYNPPEAPFEGVSNYQTDYVPRRQTPLRSLKPIDRGVASDAPFQDGTEYRQEYIKRNVAPCPAGVIEKGGPTKFVFKDQDPQGHKWYEPVMTSVHELPQSVRMNSAGMSRQLAMSVA